MSASEVAELEPVYDSATRLPLTALWRDGWRHRELVGLLVQRELASRYRGTVIGVGWAIVTPLAYAAALWIVFSNVSRFSVSGVPYVVYVLSGVIVLAFVAQGTLTVAHAVVSNTVSFRRVFVPVTTFALAAVLTAMVSLTLSTLVLLGVQIATGIGIPWTVVLLPVQFVLIASAVAGAGLLVGALSTRFADALQVTQTLIALLGIVTPIFYPVTIVPHWARVFVELNPVYRFVVLFRGLAYAGTVPTWSLVGSVVSAVFFAVIGLVVYRKMRESLPTTL
jgi:ABC-2 type transport system permease protein